MKLLLYLHPKNIIYSLNTYTMKKLVSLLFVLLIATAAIAQNRAMLLEEHFNGTAMPQGWTIDGMGTSNWHLSATDNAGGEANEMWLYYNPQFNGTSRLVTPALDLTGVNNVVFTFKHYLDNYQGSHILGIATSSDDGQTWNTGWQQNYASDGNYLVLQTIETPDMGKDNVKFCIFYTGNSYNIDNWFFDDIQIFTLENKDLMLASISIPTIANKDEVIPVNFTVTNYGLTPITRFEMSYQMNDHEPVVETFTGNVASLGNATFVFSTPISELPGSYLLRMEILSVNDTEDDNPDNNVKEKSFAYSYGSTAMVPMIEHFSSSSCSPCVSTNNVMNTFCNNNAGAFTYTKYAMNWPGSGDPYYNQDGYTRRIYYGVSAVPTVYLDAVARSASAVQSAFNSECQLPSFADIRGVFTMEGSVINVSFDLMTYVAMEGARLYVCVNEKETHNNIGGNGETTFHHVMMKMLPDGEGTTLSLEGCDVRHFDFTYDMSSTFVEEMNDLEVAVFLQDYGSKRIFNSHFLNEGGEYPAPVENLMMTFEDLEEGGLATATWDAPTLATPLGYKVIVDGEVMEELTTNLSYSFNTASEQFHVVEVQAIYETGTSIMVATGLNYIWNNEEVAQIPCRLFPNPAQDRVRIETTENLVTVNVYNALGVLVDQYRCNGQHQQINTAKLSNGVYLIEMNTENGQSMTRRLVVTH